MVVDIGLVADEAGAPLGQEKKMPRLLLRRRLGPLRKAAGKSLDDVAKHLGVSVQSVRRWENAETKIGVANLRELCRYYGVADEVYAELESLRAALSDVDWWRRFGPRPDSTAGLLEVEPAADEVRSFDLLYIPGLLQTPAYARAIIEAVELGVSRQQLNSGVELRMQRQARVFDGTPRTLTFIVDQAALERMPGTTEIRRAQLAQLRRPPEGCKVLVLPFDRGPHPAATGFTIFDFPSSEIPKAVHVESSEMTKGDFLEEEEQVQPYERYWGRLKTLALSEKDSSQFFKQMMESYR